MLATLQRLGFIPSFSLPCVSNDNPYSESLFLTLAFRPSDPSKPFVDMEAAPQWVQGFVRCYNEKHRHSAIQFVTSAQRHARLDGNLLTQRIGAYEAAKQGILSAGVAVLCATGAHCASVAQPGCATANG